MAKRKGFEAGARVRYTGAFLRNTGQYTGPAGMRRGTIVGPVPGMRDEFIGVRWDDENLDAYPGNDDPELREHIRINGAAVLAINLERAK